MVRSQSDDEYMPSPSHSPTPSPGGRISKKPTATKSRTGTASATNKRSTATVKLPKPPAIATYKSKTTTKARSKQSKAPAVAPEVTKPPIPPPRTKAVKEAIIIESSDEENTPEVEEHLQNKKRPDMSLSPGVGLQINSVLHDLGEELQHRFMNKRKRLEGFFVDVKRAPNKITEALQGHSTEKEKIIEGFRAKSKAIIEKVNHVVELQKGTEEKLSKMVAFTLKQFDSMKESLNQCVTGLVEAMDEFKAETETLEGKQDEEFKEQISALNNELVTLQKQILRDGQKDEAESIRNSLHVQRCVDNYA